MSKSTLWLVTAGGSAFAYHTDKKEIHHQSKKFKGSTVIQAPTRADAELKFKKRP